MQEFQQKQMSAEELEAKQYVEFYRFWAWEYTRRNSEFRGIVKLIFEAEKYFQGIGISGFSMNANSISSPDSIIFYQPHIKRDFTEKEFEIFEKAFFGKMNARYKFGFEFEGPCPISKHSSEDILKALQDDHELERPCKPRERSEGARLISQREIHNGIKVLYDKQFPIIGYDALVAIDFDRPIPEIQEQIWNIKKEFEIYRKIENGENDFPVDFKSVEIEKIGIQKNKDIQFKIGTDNSRAIGIWLWDFIHSDESPNPGASQIEAINSLKSNFDVAKLGYAATEESVFRMWYRNTAKCIEAAEVLHMR